MSSFVSLFMGIAGIIHSLIGIYIWVVIIAAVMSWIPPFSSNTFVQFLIRFKYTAGPFLERITQPAYALVRRIMPTSFNGIDLAPLAIVIGLQLIDLVQYSLLAAIAQSLI